MKLFVIGNGESRKDFDLNLLREDKNSIVLGCNGLYRDFKPDILIAVDDLMIDEIKSNCKFLNDIIFVHRKRVWDNITSYRLSINRVLKTDNLRGIEYIDHNINVDDYGYASGPTGVYVLLKHLFPFHEFIDSVYLIGFDLARLPGCKINSMYKDTNCYVNSNVDGATHDASTDKLSLLFGMNADVEFKRVIDNDHFPIIWKKHNNIKNINYKQLLNKIKI